MPLAIVMECLSLHIVLLPIDWSFDSGSVTLLPRTRKLSHCTLGKTRAIAMATVKEAAFTARKAGRIYGP